MRFYLNSNAADKIGVSAAVGSSPYAASTHAWQHGLKRLADTYCPKGPEGDVLEINSHGNPATLVFYPQVSFHNMQVFADLVRPLIKPGGMVEVLACHVAQFHPDALSSRIKKKDSLATTWNERAFKFELVRQLNAGTNTALSGKTGFTTQEVVALHQQAVDTGEERIDGVAPNGPLFCVRLARATQCIIRAATIIQLEEGGAKNPIGNWEGHILDFLPTGTIQYAGLNLKRALPPGS